MKADLIVVVIPRSSIEALDLGPVQMLMGNDPMQTLQMQGRICFIIDGYDDDPELPLIPDVRRYFRAVREVLRFPLFYFHDLEVSGSLGTWFLCGFDDVASLHGTGLGGMGRCPFTFDMAEFKQRLVEQFNFMNACFEVVYAEAGLEGCEEAIKERTRKIEEFFAKDFGKYPS